jgi:alanyl-tRNA synthetase
MSTQRPEWEREAEKATEELKGQAAEAREALTSKVETTASQQKQVVANEMNKFSEAVRRAAEQLRQEERSTAAGYTTDLANAINNWAETLRETNFQDAVNSLNRTAREHPVAFFGAAMLAGIAAGRLLRVTASEPHRRYGEHGGGSAAGARTQTSHYGGPQSMEHGADASRRKEDEPL